MLLQSFPNVFAGRIGEVISRTWRTAAKMKTFTGPLAEDSETDDNTRVKRYISKYTINPYVRAGHMRD